MSCTAGQCFLDKPLRRAPSRGMVGALPRARRANPLLVASAVAGDARVVPSAPAALDDPNTPALLGDAPAGEACGSCGPTCRACEPCRQKYGHLDAPATDIVAYAESAPAGALYAAPEVMTVAMPLARRSPATSVPARRTMPAGAVAVPVRPWAMLSPAERYALNAAAVDRAIDRTLLRPAGDPVPQLAVAAGVNQTQWDGMNANERADVVYGGAEGARRSLASLAARQNPDALPAWAREAGITQTTWSTMDTAAREAARQQHVAASNIGWTVAGTALQQGTAIVQSILNGDLQRDLANIQAQSAQNVAATNAAAAQFTAESNQRIADLNLAAAQANAQGNSAQAAQFQQAIQALQAAQSGQTNALAAALQGLQAQQGMSTTAKVALGLGAAAALVGLGVVVLRRR